MLDHGKKRCFTSWTWSHYRTCEVRWFIFFSELPTEKPNLVSCKIHDIFYKSYLIYNHSRSCGVDLGDFYVIIGGQSLDGKYTGLRTVAKYSKQG